MGLINKLLISFLLILARDSIATGMIPGAPGCDTTVQTYPIPANVSVATSFNVEVRSPGGKWKKIDSYSPTHDEVNFITGSSIRHTSSMIYFDFSGTVEIRAKYLHDRLMKSGSIVTFMLTEPRIVILQVNGNIFDCLHIFTNPPDADAPSADDPDTLYLAGGAVVTAPDITVTNSSNVALRGRGILYSEKGNAISVVRSNNVVIEGLIGINFFPRAYMSNDVTFHHWRGFSAVQYGDGLDLFCSQNILIDSVFLRNSDDCIANITIQSSILWADVAHPINVRTHGNTEDPETIDGLTIRNIDILDQNEKQMLYQGTIALNPGDSKLVENVLIEDVRVENIRVGQLLNFRVMYNDKYNTSPGRGIRNVFIRNLQYSGTNADTSIFTGYDADRTMSNVTIENLVVNGKAIYDTMKKPGWYLSTDFIPLYANEHVHNMTLNPSQG
ncbi:glycoside hydrolase family 28 protein [Trichoderma afarasin]